MINKKCLILFSLFFSLLYLFPLQAQPRTMIYDILSKHSEWALDVDGEKGILELLGGSGSKTAGVGWEMTSEITWQGNPGVLKAWADGKNAEQHVILEVQRKNGIKVTLDGYIARETDKFMAGASIYKAVHETVHGAWYAVQHIKETGILDTGRRLSETRPLPPAEIKPSLRQPIQPPARTVPLEESSGRCSISGKVYGSGQQAAKVFFIILYGPNNLSQPRATQKFDAAGNYMFADLPAGKYKLIVDTKADTVLGPHPAYREVECVGDAVTGIDFELK